MSNQAVGCGPNPHYEGQFAGETNELANLRRAQARKIERLSNENTALIEGCNLVRKNLEKVRSTLAESQAREVQMREAVTAHEKECRRSVGWAMFYDATLHRVVLALPHDDTALKARLKAERERCAKFVQEHAAFIDEDGDRITSAGNAILADAIRNLGDE